MDFNQVVKECFAFANSNDGSIITYPLGGPEKLEVHSNRTPRTEIVVERESKSSGNWRVHHVQNRVGEKTLNVVTVTNVSELEAQLSHFWDDREDCLMDFDQVENACIVFAKANDGSIPVRNAYEIELRSNCTPGTEIMVTQKPGSSKDYWQVHLLRNGAGEDTYKCVKVTNVSELTAQLSRFWDVHEDSSDAADTISEIFCKHLPSVSMITARDFSAAMRAYYTAFQTLRASCMNYEELPEYKARSYLMQIPADHFWPYTPHFRKVMALVIENLFKTTIISLGSSACRMEQSLTFVDQQKNRWHVTVVSSASDKNMIRIEMYFPRSNTDTISCGQRTRVDHLTDSAYLKENKLAIIVEDLNYLLGRSEEVA